VIRFSDSLPRWPDCVVRRSIIAMQLLGEPHIILRHGMIAGKVYPKV